MEVVRLVDVDAVVVIVEVEDNNKDRRDEINKTVVEAGAEEEADPVATDLHHRHQISSNSDHRGSQ